MAYEVENGKAYIYDAQCGQRKELEKVLDKTDGPVNYARLDNVEPDWEKVRKECVD